MFKTNRCCERPMSYSSESSYKYTMNENKANEYPAAMPMQSGMMGSMSGMNTMCGMNSMPGCQMPPVYECPEERVCHKEFVHNVPHIVPINTRVINHHIYRHTYTPCYTCCEENVACDVYDGCPNRF